MSCCPTCGQDIPAGSTLVMDFERRIVTAHGTPVHLTRDQMVLFRELYVSSPNIVRFKHLMSCLWANQDWPDKPENILTCQISRIRPIIHPLGLGIISEYGHGYRMVGRARPVNVNTSSTVTAGATPRVQA